MYVIDTSSNNGPNVPWKALRDHHGVGGGIVKFTQGSGYRNPDAPRDWRTLAQLGMERGAYLWPNPSDAPAADIAYFLEYANQIGGLKPGEPIFVDFEQSGGYTRERCDAWLIAAEAELDKRAAKQPVGVYASNSFLEWLGVKTGPWNDYLVWVADYGANPQITNWYGHQFTDSFAGMGLDASIFPRGLTKLELPPASTLTHQQAVVLHAFIVSHYAPILRAKVWHEMTAHPENALAVLRSHKLI